ncbi:hypothetical protein DL89DRAFT_270005, partial [Linderina pennispora]
QQTAPLQSLHLVEALQQSLLAEQVSQQPLSEEPALVEATSERGQLLGLTQKSPVHQQLHQQLQRQKLHQQLQQQRQQQKRQQQLPRPFLEQDSMEPAAAVTSLTIDPPLSAVASFAQLPIYSPSPIYPPPPMLTVYQPVFPSFDSSSFSPKKVKFSIDTMQDVLPASACQVELVPITVPILPTMTMQDVTNIVQMGERNRELVSALLATQDNVLALEHGQLQKRILALQSPILPAKIGSAAATFGSVSSLQNFAVSAANSGTTATVEKLSAGLSQSHVTLAAQPRSRARVVRKNVRTLKYGMPKQSAAEEKYCMWRIYAKGLREYGSEHEGNFLAHYDIGDLDIFHVYFSPSGTCEFIVAERDAYKLVKRLRKLNKTILDGYGPLRDVGKAEDTELVRTQYTKQLAASLAKCHNRDFKHYVDRYARDVNLSLPANQSGS